MKPDTKAIREKMIWTLKQFRESENIVDRTVWFIQTLSPHNLWKGSEAIEGIVAPHNQSLLDQIKEKKKTMADIVGTKRVETDYVTLDDILSLLSSDNSVVSSNGVKSEEKPCKYCTSFPYKGHACSKKPNEGLDDYKPFTHAMEGTHYACLERIQMVSDLNCCGCIGHKCRV